MLGPGQTAREEYFKKMAIIRIPSARAVVFGWRFRVWFFSKRNPENDQVGGPLVKKIRFKIKKALRRRRIASGGLHPVFLTLEYINTTNSAPVIPQVTAVSIKAGLLAPPPFQRPSHPALAGKWHQGWKGFFR